jgi:hypothetical protein
MISCPTCKRKAEPKARYCPACYTVFPSEALKRDRRMDGGKGGGIPWRLPSLFIVSIAAIWFVQINPYDWTAKPGSYRAVTSSMKRSIIEWAAGSVFATHASLDNGAHDKPQWAIDNGDHLPCAAGAVCEVVIRFPSGESANYLIERPVQGNASIAPMNAHGSELLGRATHATLMPAATKSGKDAVLIARKDDRWFVINQEQVSVIDANAVPPGSEQGV